MTDTNEIEVLRHRLEASQQALQDAARDRLEAVGRAQREIAELIQERDEARRGWCAARSSATEGTSPRSVAQYLWNEQVAEYLYPTEDP